MPQIVSMSELARLAKVHKTTASLALRDHPRICPATRERIKQLAREHGYRPDPAVAAFAASGWKNTHPRTHSAIAVLVNDQSPHREIQHEMWRQAEGMIRRLGYQAECLDIDRHGTVDSFLAESESRNVRGLLVVPQFTEGGIMQSGFPWERFTAVCCRVGRYHPLLHTVEIDILKGTLLAWQHCLSAGYRRIGAAVFSHEPVTDDDFYRIGACEYALLHEVPPDAPRIPLLTAPVGWFRHFEDWYRRERPEVVIGFSDALLDLLTGRMGVRVPEDCAFVSLASSRPDISGLQNLSAIVLEEALSLLHRDILENRWGLPEYPRHHTLEPVWNPGSTLPSPAPHGPAQP